MLNLLDQRSGNELPRSRKVSPAGRMRQVKVELRLGAEAQEEGGLGSEERMEKGPGKGFHGANQTAAEERDPDRPWSQGGALRHAGEDCENWPSLQQCPRLARLRPSGTDNLGREMVRPRSEERAEALKE